MYSKYSENEYLLEKIIIEYAENPAAVQNYQNVLKDELNANSGYTIEEKWNSTKRALLEAA